MEIRPLLHMLQTLAFSLLFVLLFCLYFSMSNLKIYLVKFFDIFFYGFQNFDFMHSTMFSFLFYSITF